MLAFRIKYMAGETWQSVYTIQKHEKNICTQEIIFMSPKLCPALKSLFYLK